MRIFLLKKIREASALQKRRTFFSTKIICIFGNKVVKDLTS